MIFPQEAPKRQNRLCLQGFYDRAKQFRVILTALPRRRRSDRKNVEKMIEHFSAKLSKFRWPVKLAFVRRSR
jgi:hypothetical protein